MEAGHNVAAHHLCLDERCKGLVTGITKVESFDEMLVVLVTTQGKLTIKGREMHVQRVDVERGELEFSGNVDSMVYTAVHAVSKGAKGVFKRMFQ
ncbi:MAG: YabP/YqfC family sporulation protein [Lachnospiraceae bacterium]|nr:YabP/YqfC family sporulation protein [Lachnospiraceae bacterium]